MLLTISTTNKPATDLGYLLHKNPFRCQSTKLPFGIVNVFYPEATEQKCTVAVVLDIDTIDLVRGRKASNPSMPLEQYVNDRPYVCSSFLSVSISRVFGQTLNGKCKQRPDLLEKEMPLTVKLSVLPCRGGEQFLRNLFEPLGYKVNAERYPLDKMFEDWGLSSYYTVELIKTTTVKELFNHLHVLVPVLDNQKHYYIDQKEIDKLLKRGEGWLAEHPERENIAKRYLKYRTSYAREALERLMEINPTDEDALIEDKELTEEEIEKNLNLNEERLGSVLSALKACGAETVIDLGCGEGKLLRPLLKEKQFRKILGTDVSIRSLEIASDKLRLNDLPPIQKERISLMHGSLMYRDSRFNGFDAAAVVEVIEHFDEPRLRAFERVLFEFAKPSTIVLTTPNREYNKLWENIGPDKLRHRDHRFEWTREEFRNWAENIGHSYNYTTRYLDIGPRNQEFGCPTQMCIFSKK